MPKALSDGTTKVAILTTPPAVFKSPTVTELTAGIDASCAIMDNDFKLGPTASNTVDGRALCDSFEVKALGAANYEAMMTVFRYLDADGKPDPKGTTAGDVGDTVFQTLKKKGTVVTFVVRRTSKLSSEAWEAEDEVDVYELVMDTPQYPGDRTGYLRRTFAPQVSKAEVDTVVATAA